MIIIIIINIYNNIFYYSYCLLYFLYYPLDLINYITYRTFAIKYIFVATERKILSNAAMFDLSIIL